MSLEIFECGSLCKWNQILSKELKSKGPGNICKTSKLDSQAALKAKGRTRFLLL